MADEQGQGTDPFDVQLAELQRQLSGSGQGGIGSDARMPVAPVVRDPRMERLIQLRAMRGLDPTPEQDAYLRAIAPEKEARSERLASAGAELSGIPQLGRAARGIGEAVQDPSIPNITNAAVQSSLAAFRPLTALKSLGLGYAAALANDVIGPNIPPAHGETKKGGTPKVVLPGLSPEQQSFYDAADKRLRDDDFGSAADRRQVQQQMQELRQLSNDFVRNNADSERRLRETAEADRQREYNRQIERAEVARDKEMARDVRFADTTMGKVYEKTAGVTPFLFASGTGALTRAAMKPSALSNYVLPIGAGGAEGVVAANLPLAADAYLVAPASNPTRAAYEAYARELPPDHPRRQEWMDYAARLPETNPARSAAAQELYDPAKLAERSGIGLVEGAVGGFTGSKLPQIGGRIYEGVKSTVARFLRAPANSPTTVATDAGTLPAANKLSLSSTSGATSAEPTLLGSATERNALAGPGETLPPQGQLPARARPSSRRSAPEWASEPPEGVRLPKGYYWDARVNQPRHEGGGFGEMPKYSIPRVRKEDRPRASESDNTTEARSVQIDDMRPLQYRNKLDPDE